MAVPSTKASGPRSRSKTAATVVERASAPAKTAAEEAGNLVRKRSTAAAAASKAVKKETAMTLRSSKPSGPSSRSKTAAKAVKSASIPPQTAANEAARLAKKGSNEAAAAGKVVTAITVRSTKAHSAGARKELAANAVELASLSPKSAVNETIRLVAEASKAAAPAGESVKNETVSAIDTYRDAATETLDSTGEVVSGAGEIVTGIAEIHETMWNSMQRVIHVAVEMPAQFAACTSFADLAEKQRDVMRLGFYEWFNIGQEVLMANWRISDRAIRALELR